LFGAEIVSMLVGVTWPLGQAFAITAAGTLLGEIANYFVFKYCCTARSEKMEKTQISYGVLAHVVREGGFWVVLIIRFSALPSHFATAVFSAVGISFLVFIAAAVLSLPKPLVPVYLGYALRPDVNSTSSGPLVVYELEIFFRLGEQEDKYSGAHHLHWRHISGVLLVAQAAGIGQACGYICPA
ncbi:hypothetical protein FB45DRAFT_739189, partial [Roridomyces roridus]